MKKLISILLILSLMCLVCGSLAEETEKTEVIPSLWETGAEHQLVRKDFPLYLGALEYSWLGEFPLYFAEGADDLPFMDLKDFEAFMNYVWKNSMADFQFTTDANPDTGIVMCSRENGSTAVGQFFRNPHKYGIIAGFL